MKIQSAIQTLAAVILVLGPCICESAYATSNPVKTEVSTTQAVKVGLNKSDAKALMQVKGMSAYKAHAIVAYRKQNGEFKTMEDLVKVKGFKRMKPENMKPLTDQLMLD